MRFSTTQTLGSPGWAQTGTRASRGRPDVVNKQYFIRKWSKLKDTLSLVTVGHRDIFDINVPVIFLKFWYQCPTLVPSTEHRFYPHIGWVTILYRVTYFLLCLFTNDVTTPIPANTPLPNWIPSTSSNWTRISPDLEVWYQVSRSWLHNFDIVPWAMVTAPLWPNYKCNYSSFRQLAPIVRASSCRVGP